LGFSTSFRDEARTQSAFLAMPTCVLHPWLITFCWRTAGLCAWWKCQLLNQARAGWVWCSGGEETLRKSQSTDPTAEVQLRQADADGGRRTSPHCTRRRRVIAEKPFLFTSSWIPVHELEDSHQPLRHIQYE